MEKSPAKLKEVSRVGDRPLIIGGVPRETGQWLEVKNPHTGELVGRVAVATEKEVELATKTTQQALRVTERLPGWRRIEILHAIADLIAEHREELAELITAEVAKPIDLSRGEADRAVDTFRFAAAELAALRGEQVPLDLARRGEGKSAMTIRVSVGPVLAITPFNFPLNLVAHKLAPAIAAGCPILIKPTPKAPFTCLRLAELVLQAGWPPEALSVLVCSNELARRLVADRRFRLFTFTGSNKVGWELRNLADRKKVILELGGDAAVIVSPDAPDWERVIARLALGAFAYSGQVCISVQRVFAHRSIYQRLVDDLVAYTQDKVRVGAPDEEGVLVSSLIDDGAANRVQSWVEDAVAKGARLHCGGHRQGRLFDPMVLTDLPQETPLACEEAFAPLVVVFPYDELEEAFYLVNRSPFGLQAGIFTQSLSAAHRALRELRVGAVVVNDIPTFRVDNMPYGGEKESGLGREGLRYALEEYTEPRLMVIDLSS